MRLVDGLIISDYGKGICTKKICREIIGACRAQIEEAAQKVIDEFNLSSLVVTRSAEGLSLIDGEKFSHIKARAQEVFDKRLFIEILICV